jgi:signal transduction histidine kinase
MAARLVVYVPLLFLAAAISAALAVYTWRHREEPGAMWLSGMLVGMTAWAGFYALGLLTGSLELRLLWLKLNWMGSGFVPTCWLLFALAYSGRTEWINRWTVGALSAVPVATVVLGWTAPWHDLMWSNASVQERGVVTLLEYDAGLWYDVFDVYTYLLIGAATVLLVGMVLRHRDLYADQAVALLAGSFFPAVGYLAVLLEFIRSGVDVTPLTFPVTGVLFGYTIFRGNLMDALSPTATVGAETAVESMQDGVVVLDGDGTVIEHNRAARDLFGKAIEGRSVDDVDGLGDVALDGERQTVEGVGPDGRRLEVTVTPIRDVHERKIGDSLVVRDVTGRQMAREHLEVSNRMLRHNLRNELGVVISHAEVIEELTEDPAVSDSTDRIREAATTLTESGRKARLPEGVLDGDRDRERVDFAALARSAVETARSEYPDATISVEAPDTAHGLAMRDVQRALEELVENSAEHAGETPTVAVAVRTEAGAVCVTVSDDGPGVPEHERNVVTASEETALEHGSGAGLYLVRWLVEWSGGTLSFDDERSTVELRFDRADGE